MTDLPRSAVFVNAAGVAVCTGPVVRRSTDRSQPARKEGSRMLLTSHAGVPASPMRLLKMLSDRFGLFKALAYSTTKLNRCMQADELAMDPLVAEPTDIAPEATVRYQTT